MKKLTAEELRDKIYGCFLGKNIGGTLGMPFEGNSDLQDIHYFIQDPNGKPLPNDDLDLQLLWLTLAEYYGLENLTSRHFGEAWTYEAIGPWGEYSNCRWNCQLGFMPPLSGSLNNERWKRSNGAWIRSEIWACLAAGRPDDAIEYAWLDASADHADEGIYAEMFTAALEAAAFYVSDLHELVAIANSKLPRGCRVRQSTELVVKGFDAGKSWQDVRNDVVELNKDMGWFQAPGNVAFTVIGLLYGKGDFGESMCIAVNCGDDTDCTGATAGSVMGIIYGAKAIPEKWLKPVGDDILTCSLSNFSAPVRVPKTITELTERIVMLRNMQAIRDPRLDEPQQDFRDPATAQALWQRSTMELRQDMIFCELGIDYLDTPVIAPGATTRIRLTLRDVLSGSATFKFRWLLPEGWSASQEELFLGARNYCDSSIDCTLTAPEELYDAVTYLTLAVTTDKRCAPELVSVPFALKDAINLPGFDANRQTKGARKHSAILARTMPFRTPVKQ